MPRRIQGFVHAANPQELLLGPLGPHVVPSKQASKHANACRHKQASRAAQNKTGEDNAKQIKEIQANPRQKNAKHKNKYKHVPKRMVVGQDVSELSLGTHGTSYLIQVMTQRS